MITDGARVVLKAFPGKLKPFADAVGIVETIDQRAAVALVAFEGEPAAVPVPLPYLADAPREKPPRRGPLTLSAPPDERDEADRLAEGAATLEQLPGGLGGRRRYTVMRIGQGKDAAICSNCSRLDREHGGSGMVKIFCKNCGSGGVAPSTNSTKGVPDTLVFRADYPQGAACMVEWKRKSTGKRTDEQKALEVAERIFVAWDTPSFFDAIYRFELSIGVTPHPQLVAWLEKGR